LSEEKKLKKIILNASLQHILYDIPAKELVNMAIGEIQKMNEEEKPLKCETCGHRFDFSEAEQHEASMSNITIGCTKCSSPINYLRAHIEDDEDEYD
jgi:DNA-directed RNA polymerase subunit RPC12/RpoP